MARRAVTTTEHRIGGALVTIARWRLPSATACIHVTANGPGGVKSWEAKSQGPSSGGFNKAVQAASRVHFKINGVWGSEGSEDLESIARAAAAAVDAKSNPKRRFVRVVRRGSRRNPETEQRELELFIVNDGDLYRQRVQPIIANLAKKTRKGVYDHAKAAKLWGYLADAGAQKYTKDFDARGSTSFASSRRRTALRSPSPSPTTTSTTSRKRPARSPTPAGAAGTAPTGERRWPVARSTVAPPVARRATAGASAWCASRSAAA